MFRKITKKINFFYQNKSWFPYLIFFILIFGVYGQSLTFGYSYFDDQHLILNNADILSRASIQEIFLNDVFFSVDKFYYRPFLTWSLVLDWHLGAGNIYFFHLSNIIYHFLASSLLFILLKLSKVSRDKAFILTLFFAAHPALTQAVAWVPGRNDSLLAIFVFASLIFFSQWLKSEKNKYLILLWLSFLLALFTKEVAIFLPFLALAWALVFEIKNISRSKVLLASTGVLVVIFIWYLARNLALGKALGTSLLSSVFDNLLTPFLFLEKIFLPFNLSVYPTLTDANYWLNFIIFIIILLLIYRSGFKSWPQFIFSLLWFYLILLFSSLRPDGEEARNLMEHRLYLPMFGILILLAQLKLPKFIRFRGVTIGVLLLFFSFLSIQHSLHFKSSFSFWHQAIASSPNSALAHRNLGAMYYLDGNLDEAESLFKKSLQINPLEPMANNNLAAIYLDRNELELAEEHLEAELAINPRYDLALFNLGNLHYQRENYSQAVFYWEKTLSVNPRHHQAAAILNNIYSSLD